MKNSKVNLRKRIKKKICSIKWFFPVSRRELLHHRYELSILVKAVKEIEAMNRADISAVIAVNENLIKKINEIEKKHIREDVMFK